MSQDEQYLADLMNKARRAWVDTGALLQTAEWYLSEGYTRRGTDFWPVDASGVGDRPEWWMPNAALFAFSRKGLDRLALLVSVIFGDRYDTGRLVTPLATATVVVTHSGLLPRPTIKGGYRMYFTPLCDDNCAFDGKIHEVNPSKIDPNGTYKIEVVRSLAVPLARLRTSQELHTTLLDPIVTAANHIARDCN